MSEQVSGFDIAIVGMAGKFPGANNISEFWQNLCDGVESVTQFTDEELLESGVDPALIADPNYIKSRCIISDEDKFDAYFFDYSPREIEIMDPQQRLFLETAWNALEDAGYVPFDYEGMIGLFGGVSMNTYLFSLLNSHNGVISSSEGYQLAINNDKDFLTTRISYKLNLTGPSVVIQTACSTSLVAIHVACQNLLNYSCDMALAGGVSINIPQKTGYYYQEGMILSKDGHCRAFDEKASGTISGSGAGIVVLKRLEEALEQRDHIYAVIKGSSYNNDGSLRVGYTAPSVEGQAEVIANAQAMAGVHPESIGYIEAHGTGTELGDPIEIAALTQVFHEQSDKNGFCAVGSVKTNIGHLDAAAGVAGLIKTALALKYKKIPPSLHFEKPNPKIGLENSPFFINNRLNNWEINGNSRRAGVSSFGIGGTNAHVVLEESPVQTSENSSHSHHLILLSAKTNSALGSQTQNILDHLLKNPDLNLADLSYTLQVGRQIFNNKRMLVCKSFQDAVEVIENRNPKRILGASLGKKSNSPSIAFMFSGQGAQYVNMGLGLYETEPVFKNYLDKCCEILIPHLGFDLRAILFPKSEHADESEKKLNQTINTQPALFVIEYALSKLLISWGIKPGFMVGHSIGEYVAAHLAGVFSLEDVLKLVATRGRLMQSLPPGAMLSIPLDEEEISQFLSDDIAIAAINSKDNIVLSGTFEAIEKLEKNLLEKSINCRKLFTSHAFHSSMMEPILNEFIESFSDISLNQPTIPYLSNTTGTWITTEQATDLNYYAKHLRNTVRFSDNVFALLDDENTIFLEVGPGKALSTLASRNPNFTIGRLILSTVKHPKEERVDFEFLLTTIGRLWLNGVKVNWENFYKNEKRFRIPLPTYPFERKSYWVKTSKNKSMVKLPGNSQEKKPISEWFYTPSWEMADFYNDFELSKQEKKWLLLIPENHNFFSKLKLQLQSANQSFVEVFIGEKFEQISKNTFKISPNSKEDYKKLFNSLNEENFIPDNITHAWSVQKPQPEPDFDEIQKTGFFSILRMAQAIHEKSFEQSIRIGVVTSNLFDITGSEVLNPNCAPVLGLCKVIPQEIPNIKFQIVDFDEFNDREIIKQTRWFMSEFFTQEPEITVGYRNKHRWKQIYNKVKLNGKTEFKSLIRKNGVYLITGGLGRIGLVFAEYLIKSYDAFVVLIDQMKLPERKDWENFIKSHSETDRNYYQINQLLELEKMSGKFKIISTDVSDKSQMTEKIEEISSQFNSIHGIIHAAGKVGESVIQLVTDVDSKNFDDQVPAKVTSAKIIDDLTKEKNLDFILYQSSLSSILGGLGFASYSAVNSYLDVYANSRNGKNKTKYIAVNWDGWKFEGEELAGDAESSITPEDGKYALEKILTEIQANQVIVSTGDLNSRIEKWLIKQPGLLSEDENEINELHERPNLQTMYVEPKTELEIKIVNVWRKILGIEKIGIYDDFFDLGGDSLIGTQLVSQLRDLFKVELPLRSLFDDPTISAIAALIEKQQQSKKQGEDKIADIFGELEKMTDEEAKSMATSENFGNGARGSK